MTKFDKQDSFETVSKWTPRKIDFLTHFREGLGKLDSDADFDNEFQQFELFMKLIRKMNNAIKYGVINIPDELIPDPKILEKIKKIWSGGTWYGVIRDDNGMLLERKLYFSRPPLESKLDDKTIKKLDEDGFFHNEEMKQYYSEKIFSVKALQLPPYSGCIPVRQIKEETWAIQIRTTLPINVAFNGASIESIMLDGKFFRDNGNDPTPKFTVEEFHAGSKRTNFIHRPVYFKITGDFESKMQDLFSEIDMGYWQRIITYISTGGDMDIEKMETEKLLAMVKQ